MAPTGVIEFVPKADPMVEPRLRHREDLFAARSSRLPGGLVETRQTLPQRFREVLQGALP